MILTDTPQVAGIGLLPNGTYEIPERDMALTVIQDALRDSTVELASVDGLYMPSPRPWTQQKFFSTYLAHMLGLDITTTVEISTGGTSSAHAFHSAVRDIRSGTIETALVLAFERNSTVETTGAYFDYVVRLFDNEFQSPIGMTIPSVYAQSMQRYMYEYGIEREDLASIVVKNRANGVRNPDTIFEKDVSQKDVVNSREISEPICLYDCPAPCDGAAALLLTNGDIEAGQKDRVYVTGTGTHHAPSHLLSTRHPTVTELPAVKRAAQKASSEAEVAIDDVDVFEPYAPFPHIEAIITEEIGFAERGAGVDACMNGLTAPDGPYPISPSGGCLGRGHPPMVTPMINYIESVRQLRGTAANQVTGARTAMATAEHGHVNGVTATVFAMEPVQ